MTDIGIKRDPATGAAILEINSPGGADLRLRLRDKASGKYLTKRGWSKTPAALTEQPVAAGDGHTLLLAPELARRIPDGAVLVVDDPARDFEAELIWPAAPPGTVAAAVESPADEPLEPAILDETIAHFEKSLKDDETLRASSTKPILAGDLPASESAPRRPLLPMLAAAFAFTLLGGAISYGFLGSGSKVQTPDTTTEIARLKTEIASTSADLDAARKAETSQKVTIADLNKKLEAAVASADAARLAGDTTTQQEIAALDARVKTLTADLDAARQQLTAREADLRKAEEKAAQAAAETAAVKAKAADAADGQIEALAAKMNALSAAQAKSEKTLAERDAELRDAQAKLSVAGVQLDALRELAAKSTEADLEKTALADKLATLTTELDTARRDLTSKEEALTVTRSERDEIRAKAEADAKRYESLLAERDANAPPQQAAQVPDTQLRELQEERDLYSTELKNLTESFERLRDEKAALEKTIAANRSDVASAGANDNATTRAIWGAAAIDEGGTVYVLQNQTSEKVARNNATAICRGKSRFGCEPLATFSNACFSLARFKGEGPATDNYGYVVHKNWKISAAGALERCQGLGGTCDVRLTTCSPDSIGEPVED